MTRILVVDDEPHVASVIADILRDEGYSVELAVDGHQMLEQVETSRPALVLLDVMMPGLSGIDVLYQLRARPHLHGLPVVMMSAGVRFIEVVDPVKGFLPKPFELNDLLSVVDRLVGPASPDGLL